MRVLVCGGRDFRQDWLVFRVLADLYEQLPNDEWLRIISGAAPKGPDTFALEWAWSWHRTGHRVYWEEYPADWKLYGRSAGPIRNQEMLDSGIDLVIAFPGGRGTADMVRRARKAGVEVREVANG